MEMKGGRRRGSRSRPSPARAVPAPESPERQASVDLDVDGAGLAALVGLEVVGDALVLGEAAQAGALERADMDERVLAAVLGGDETVSLLDIEEFDFSGNHLGLPSDGPPRVAKPLVARAAGEGRGSRKAPKTVCLRP